MTPRAVAGWVLAAVFGVGVASYLVLLLHELGVPLGILSPMFILGCGLLALWLLRAGGGLRG